MSEPLFRPEVLAAKRRSGLGGISLAQPLSLWLLTGCALLAAGAIVLFLTLGEYTRRSRVIGQLVPDLGLVTVVAPVSGVISAQMPQEGEQVTPAQALAVILVQRATSADGDMVEGLRAELLQQRSGIEQGYRSQGALLAAQASGYSRQMAIARQELAQIDAEVSTRGEQLRLAEELLDRYRALAAQRFVSDLQLKEQEQATLQQRGALQELQRQSTAAGRNLQQIEQALRELPAQESLQAATHKQELAQLEQERLQAEAGAEVLVQAPVGGLIASRLIEPGQSVQAGRPLLSLLPTGARLQAQLLVPSRAIGFIEAGDSVVLRYQAFPHQKFGHYRGKVARVSRSALTADELGALTGSAQAGEPHYRVLVDLPRQSIVAYGKSEPLRPGMLLEADILGERRKLYEWALEPLYSLTGKL